MRHRQSVKQAMPGAIEYPEAFLLIVCHDQADLLRRLDQVDGVIPIVDRRRGERRTRQDTRIAIQRPHADRRVRTWVPASLAAEGAAVVRM